MITEAAAGNMGAIAPRPGFNAGLRAITAGHGALLIMDEVMTGFRVALGSAQSVYAKAIPGFRPDLTVLGKVIGGGMPLAASTCRPSSTATISTPAQRTAACSR